MSTGTLALTDPILAWAVMFGPRVPYQYRLHGPDAWEGARHAILTVEDRIKESFTTRGIEKNGHKGVYKNTGTRYLLKVK